MAIFPLEPTQTIVISNEKEVVMHTGGIIGKLKLVEL